VTVRLPAESLRVLASHRTAPAEESPLAMAENA
jgi:hypothetical protein